MANISQKWLGMCSLLVPLTRNYAADINASTIARLISLPQKTVARQLIVLEKLHFVRYRRDGRNKYYFLDLGNPHTFSLLQLVESYKALQFTLGHPELAFLLGELASRGTVILFGSYAKGTEKKDSDVDIVALSGKTQRLVDTIKRHAFTVSAQYVSLELLERKLAEKQPLALEIARDHVVFGGNDGVVNAFLSHWKK